MEPGEASRFARRKTAGWHWVRFVARPSSLASVSQRREHHRPHAPGRSPVGDVRPEVLRGAKRPRGWPGRPGWLPTQAPHRSGRAEFQHPVPHLMSSLPARSGAVALTGFRSRCTSPVSVPQFMRRCPLPSPGSLRLVPLAQRYYGHCDSLTLVSPRFVSFAWRYLGASAFRPRAASDARPTDLPGVCDTGCSRAGLLQGNAWVSQVPVKPL